MGSIDYFAVARKNQEALAVRSGAPVSREFSDVEIARAINEINEVEAELGAPLSKSESIDRLRLAKTYQVCVEVGDEKTIVPVIDSNPCSAITRVLDFMFPDFDSDKPEGLKISATHIQKEWRVK